MQRVRRKDGYYIAACRMNVNVCIHVQKRKRAATIIVCACCAAVAAAYYY